MDEKALEFAWAAWKGSLEIESKERLKAAITAYEQARERVAVPGREEIAAGLSTAYQSSELNADEALEFDDIPEDERKRHLWMADYVLTLLRQAPTSERVAFEVTEEEARRAWGGKTADWAGYLQSINVVLATRRQVHIAPQSFNIGNQHVFFLEGEWRALDIEAGSGDEGYYASGELQSVVDEALEAELSGRLVDQRPAPSAQPRMHSEACDEHLMQLERDLAAERAAHQATKDDCERRLNDWQDTHEQEVEQLKDDLATERAAHEATRARLEREMDLANERLCCGEYGTGSDMHGEDCVYTRLEEATAEADRRGAAAQKAAGYLTRAESAEKRVAELEAQLATAIQHEGNIRQAWKNVEARAAELERELAEARAKLEALVSTPQERVAIDALRENQREYRGVIGYCDRIQSALAQESAKPAEPKPVFHDCTFKNSPFTVWASVPTPPGPGESVTLPLNLRDGGCSPSPEPNLPPKPGDVLSGEAAKAYMLANPGRRVAHAVVGSEIFMGCHGEIGQVQEGHVYIGANIFCDGHYRSEEFIALHPEPAKPAIPELDLAGRVRVLEELAKNTATVVIANLRGWHTVAPHCGPTFERIDMALKALEGGGSQ